MISVIFAADPSSVQPSRVIISIAPSSAAARTTDNLAGANFGGGEGSSHLQPVDEGKRSSDHPGIRGAQTRSEAVRFL